MKFSWIGRRWMELKLGYSGYLVFIISFSTFVTVLHSLVPEIKEAIEFHYFIGIIILIIAPTAILIGHAHFKTQFRVETEVMLVKNPFNYKLLPNSIIELQTSIQLTILEELRSNYSDVKNNLLSVSERKEKLDKSIKMARHILAGNDTRVNP